jgi:hypothetical protein
MPGTSWRLDETYVRVKGDWKYLYRAVDKAGQTMDFLLTAHSREMAKRNKLQRNSSLRWLHKSYKVMNRLAYLKFATKPEILGDGIPL